MLSAVSAGVRFTRSSEKWNDIDQNKPPPSSNSGNPQLPLFSTCCSSFRSGNFSITQYTVSHSGLQKFVYCLLQKWRAATAAIKMTSMARKAARTQRTALGSHLSLLDWQTETWSWTSLTERLRQSWSTRHSPPQNLPSSLTSPSLSSSRTTLGLAMGVSAISRKRSLATFSVIISESVIQRICGNLVSARLGNNKWMLEAAVSGCLSSGN